VADESLLSVLFDAFESTFVLFGAGSSFASSFTCFLFEVPFSSNFSVFLPSGVASRGSI